MSRRILTKDTAAIAASMMSGLGMILHSATKRKTKRSESGAVIEKNRFNRQRADHKLENRAAGGKKY